jgi:hypothetical protein
MRTRLGVEATRQTKCITKIDQYEKKMLATKKKFALGTFFSLLHCPTKMLSNRMSMLVKNLLVEPNHFPTGEDVQINKIFTTSEI